MSDDVVCDMYINVNNCRSLCRACIAQERVLVGHSGGTCETLLYR
jgi:hypothetical protein